MSDNADVMVAVEQGIMTITFNRPEKKNALTTSMYQSMNLALEQAAEDSAISVVLFTGSGDCFTAGNDIADFLKAGEDIEQRPVGKLLMLLSAFKKPVVAAVQGNAIGIGTTMLLHCDLVVAATDAKFALPFVALGLCPEAASSLLLPKLAGYQQAAELLMLGEAFSAEKAESIGLINRVVDSEKVKQQALELCQKLTTLPAQSLLLTKQLMKTPGDNVQERLRLEFGHFTERLQSDDARKVFQAFLAK